MTSDGGQTWVNLMPGEVPYFRVDFVDPTYGWVIPYGGEVERTTDGGKTWECVKLAEDYSCPDELKQTAVYQPYPGGE